MQVILGFLHYRVGVWISNMWIRTEGDGRVKFVVHVAGDSGWATSRAQRLAHLPVSPVRQGKPWTQRAKRFSPNTQF